MSAGSIIMMIIILGIVFGGAIYCINIAANSKVSSDE